MYISLLVPMQAVIDLVSVLGNVRRLVEGDAESISKTAVTNRSFYSKQESRMNPNVGQKTIYRLADLGISLKKAHVMYGFLPVIRGFHYYIYISASLCPHH